MTEQELWPKCPLKLINPNLSVRARYVRMRECTPMCVCTDGYMHICALVFKLHLFVYVFQDQVADGIYKLSN